MHKGCKSLPFSPAPLSFYGNSRRSSPSASSPAKHNFAGWNMGNRRTPECGTIPVSWSTPRRCPGLVHSSQPAFPMSTRFAAGSLILNRVAAGRLQGAIIFNAGVPNQEPATGSGIAVCSDSLRRAGVAILRSTSAVWRGGLAEWSDIGEHLPWLSPRPSLM